MNVAKVLKKPAVYADTRDNRAEMGASTVHTRPSSWMIFAQVLALAGAVVVGVATAGYANWNLPLLFTLLAFSAVGDLLAVETRSKIKISGSFLATGLGDGVPWRSHPPRYRRDTIALGGCAGMTRAVFC